jgi:8-amino-7-oxononanoate synthase
MLTFMNEHFLEVKLNERKQLNAYRELRLQKNVVDFCSNDYLGLSNALSNDKLEEEKFSSGSKGSRLLAGNYPLIEEVEKEIAAFHESTAGLIFNSGYDANVGLMSCAAQRGDTILYDHLSHASIRDGVRLSFAQSYSFAHNDVVDLEKKLKTATGTVFVITESVFSMDGDVAPLEAIVQLCKQYNARLIVDEAHATGIIGAKGEGLAQQLQLHQHCFARIHTFGKALGCHGAIVLGSYLLREYLINFSRAFIYTTALPESAIAVVRKAYQLFPGMYEERNQLLQLINSFQNLALDFVIPKSNTPIQAVIIPGNDVVKFVAARLQQQQLDVRAILYPTVPKGSERLRVVLHSFNTVEQVRRLGEVLAG